jgi:D-arabinose 1-dehydrogenase-like Zn-dependent alcohol dehydrogenase
MIFFDYSFNHLVKIKTLKVLACIEPGKFKYKKIGMPVLGQNQAIIKIKRMGICRTDQHAFEGMQAYFIYPSILDHEWAGGLISFYNAPGFIQGEAVTFIPYSPIAGYNQR